MAKDGLPMHHAPSSQIRVGAVLKRFRRLLRPVYLRFADALPASWHVKLEYFRAHGRWPNLSHPQKFNEKIAWRKLCERDARLPGLSDKIQAKRIVGARFGYDLINPTLAVYSNANEMDFTKLPLSAPPYVIKANHGSGMNIFVRDEPINQSAIREKVDKWMKIDHSSIMEEWAYSRIKPRILIEPDMGDTARLTDYKFHVFSGSVYAIEVVLDRFGDYRINFYNPDWIPLEIKRYANRPPSDAPVAPPNRLADMLKLAEAIGSEFSYVRVDLYEIDGRIRFGELTFYTGAANDRFEPDEWDLRFGQQWVCELPKNVPEEKTVCEFAATV
jgi:hypothetical protein